MPRQSVLENWSAQVPDDFRFTLKASRRITHRQRLEQSAETVGYLFDTAVVLGNKLGPVLFQLPPFFRKDLPRLESFLSLWPRELPAALRGQGRVLAFRYFPEVRPQVLCALSPFRVARRR